MAINPKSAMEFFNNINILFEEYLVFLDDITKTQIKKMVFSPIIIELEKLVFNSRPPIIYLIGRSGHGKSSLVNCLANKKVAETNPIQPETEKSTEYDVYFDEFFSSWKVIDTRGFFESTKPNELLKENATEFLIKDIIEKKPDIIIHVIAASECRNLEKDFELFDRIVSEHKKQIGLVPPTIIAISKIDIIDDPQSWPPESNPGKGETINSLLEYMSSKVLKCKTENLNNRQKYYGVKVIDERSPYVGIIPVVLFEKRVWNVDSLSELIQDVIPDEAKLQFIQAQRRRHLLRQLSSSMIKKFSSIAGGMGAVPIPISDIAILTPLQLLLIALVGGLSCRPFSKETAKEYMTAAGINLVAAIALREVARTLLKFVPIAGAVISGAIAGASTYAIGKAAEAYFFDDKVVDPEIYRKEYEEDQ